MAQQRRKLMWLSTTVFVVVGAGALQCIAFPTTAEIRVAISVAERVELHVFIEGNEEAGRTVAVITEREDIDALAQSIRIVGIWLPLDELIGNSYRITAVNGEVRTDIIIRGGYRIKDGCWFASISPQAMEVFMYLVAKQGGTIPHPRELLVGEHK